MTIKKETSKKAAAFSQPIDDNRQKSPSSNNWFAFREDLSDSERDRLSLLPDYVRVFSSKQDSLNAWLSHAQDAFFQGNLTQAAKDFRSLAGELKILEATASSEGTYDTRNSLNDLTGKEWLKHTKSWVIVDGKPSDIDIDIENHPASYPPELCKFFIEFFTKHDDWVFDPFMGIGSTFVASYELKRNCWGIELNPKYAQYAESRIPIKTSNYKIFTADARDSYKIWKESNLPGVKFIITSPPYWNMLAESRGGVKSIQKQRIEEGFDEKYSDDPRDIGNIDQVETYLEEMKKIFLELKKIMVPGGYIMIILQNIRPKDGIMQPIAWRLALALKKDFNLRQEFIWCQDQKFMGIWGYPKTFVSNVHHHYCLVFQKDE